MSEQKVKRYCGRAAAGTESAAISPMVEWYADGGDDQQTPYVLASDFERIEADLAQATALLRGTVKWRWGLTKEWEKDRDAFLAEADK